MAICYQVSISWMYAIGVCVVAISYQVLISCVYVIGGCAVAISYQTSISLVYVIWHTSRWMCCGNRLACITYLVGYGHRTSTYNIHRRYWYLGGLATAHPPITFTDDIDTWEGWPQNTHLSHSPTILISGRVGHSTSTYMYNIHPRHLCLVGYGHSTPAYNIHPRHWCLVRYCHSTSTYNIHQGY